MLRGRKNLLHVNKKKQKNFVDSGPYAPVRRPCIPIFSNKGFLLLFFKQDAS